MGRPMRARRVDANSTELCDAFERLGFSVWKVNDVVDAVISLGGLSWAIEIKDGKKPPSARKLTPRAERFRATWRGGIYLAKDLKDVERLAATFRRWVQMLQEKLAFATDDYPRSYGGGTD